MCVAGGHTIKVVERGNLFPTSFRVVGRLT